MMVYETMVKKSSAAANLSSWVCNVYAYKRIYDNVKPLMDALEEAQVKKRLRKGHYNELKTKLLLSGQNWMSSESS